MSARRCRRVPRGFTLIELAVALALAGLVALVALGTLRVAADASTRLRADEHVALASLAARGTLEGWLHAATVLDGSVAFAGVHRRGIEGARDELAFAVLDGGPLYPGPRHVRLRVDDDAATRATGLVAEIRPLRGVGAPDTLVVAPDVAGLRLRYRTTESGRARWQDDWHSVRELPAAVELRLVPADGGALAPLLALPLVVPLGWGAR